MRLTNIILTSSYNLKPAAYPFLASIGVSREEVDIAQNCHAWYQGLMRCALRSLGDQRPVTAVAGPAYFGEWVRHRILNFTVIQLPGVPDELATKNGRSDKRHSTNADRQRAYREREKLKKLGLR